MLPRREFLQGASALAFAGIARPAIGDTTVAALRDRHGRLQVAVHVNGQGPFSFLLDTGASHSAISPEIAEQLLLGSAEVDVPVNSIGGRSASRFVRISSLEVGSLRLSAQKLAVLDSAATEHSGIIGTDMLAGRQLVVDFLRPSVSIFETPQAPVGSGWIPTVALERSGLMAIEVEVDSQPCNALVDTGAERSVGNYVLQHSLRDHVDEPRKSAIIRGADPRIKMQASAKVVNIAVGRVSLAPLELLFTSSDLFPCCERERAAMLLGMDVLRQFAEIALDYRHRMIRLIK